MLVVMVLAAPEGAALVVAVRGEVVPAGNGR